MPSVPLDVSPEQPHRSVHMDVDALQHLQQHCQQILVDDSQIRALVRAELLESMSNGMLKDFRAEVKADLIAELTGEHERATDVVGASIASKRNTAGPLNPSAVCQNRPSRVRSSRGSLSRCWQQKSVPSSLSAGVYALDMEEIMASAQIAQNGFPLLDVAVERMCAQDDVYDFSPTMWDILPFCCLGVLTIVDQIFVLVVAALNMASQCGFVGLVATHMIDNDFSDSEIVGTLRDWRVLYAHNPDFADAFTDEPLAKNICDRSFFRMQGASQASIYNDLDDYTQPFLTVPAGGIMCLLAVALWFLTCAKELKEVLLFARGIWTSNDGSISIWSRTNERSSVQVVEEPIIWIHGEARQKNYQIFLTPCRRSILTMLVILPRLIILTSLAFFGCLFLVSTVQLHELILNAVALDVVMNLDELLFQILAPEAATRMVYKTLPLRVRPFNRNCEQAEPWIKLALVIIMLVLVAWFYLAPMIANMRGIISAMCDGDQNFLAIQIAYGAVVATPTTPIDMNLIRNTYKYGAMLQRTQLEDASTDTKTWLYLQGGRYTPRTPSKVFEMKTWRDRTLKDFAELSTDNDQMLSCHDLSYVDEIPDVKRAMMEGIGSLTGNESMQNCQDVAHLCFNDTSVKGNVARLICPITCGAMGPQSGLIMSSTSNGVPIACSTSFAGILGQYWNFPCQEANASTLLQNIGWSRYAEGITVYLKPHILIFSLDSTGKLNQTHANLLKHFMWDNMKAHGCAFFANPVSIPKAPPAPTQVGIDFCDPKHPYAPKGGRSARPFCPLTCKCHTLVKKHWEHLVTAQASHVLSESQCPMSCLMR